MNIEPSPVHDSPNNVVNKTTQNDSLPMEWMKLKVGKCLSPTLRGIKPVPLIFDSFDSLVSIEIISNTKRNEINY
jgi:hypothetical protein